MDCLASQQERQRECWAVLADHAGSEQSLQWTH